MVIDTAHGHSKGVIETIRILKGNIPKSMSSPEISPHTKPRKPFSRPVRTP
jgi:hypothetical protein